MNPKYLFVTLFVLAGTVSLWLSALFFSQLITYLRYSHHTQGEALHWGVVSRDETHHKVSVDYTFQIDSKTYRASHTFLKPNYQGREAAEYGKEAMEKDRLDVWYTPQGPHSMLERAFPYNELFRLAIVLAILVYFFFLRQYFSHFSIQDGKKAGAESK